MLATKSPAEALAGLSTLEGVPDLIIADYRLEELVTGDEAIRRIEAEVGAPISALS